MNSNPFAAAVEKANALREQFAALPETVIHGVVGANGARGGKGGKEVMWNLNFELVAWRPVGGVLRDTALKVTKSVTAEELKGLQMALRAQSIVAISARLCEDSPFGDARAQLVDVLLQPEDAELEQKLADYVKPQELQDPLLGRLVFNKAIEWFEGKTPWLRHDVRVSLGPDGNGSIAIAKQTAQALWQNPAEWEGKARLFAAEKMLANKNENWLKNDEAVLTPVQFMDKLRLTSITLGPLGKFEFWFDDGGLFWGHWILVSGTLDKGFADADIAG